MRTKILCSRIHDMCKELNCRSCNEKYIGKTENYLKKGVTIHNRQIRDPKTRMLYVSKHIGTCAHQLNPKYRIVLHYENSPIQVCRTFHLQKTENFQIITKTCLYNFDPFKPHFYIVKLGFTRVYIIFLISAQNIDCGYS